LPYGDKSPEAILQYSLEIGRFLVAQGAKALVIACNTASAIAYDALVQELGDQVPIFNVIDPVVEATAVHGHQKVGVIGTRATILSGAYNKRLFAANSKIEVKSMATPLLVPVIEEGLAKSQISTDVLSYYLSKPELENVTALILGCTHYPILHEQIVRYLKGNVEVIDSPMIVAETISQVLDASNLLADKRFGTHQFFVSDYTETFEFIARQFFGNDLNLEERKM
jgi:glutamate racemase